MTEQRLSNLPRVGGEFVRLGDLEHSRGGLPLSHRYTDSHRDRRVDQFDRSAASLT